MDIVIAEFKSLELLSRPRNETGEGVSISGRKRNSHCSEVIGVLNLYTRNNK
jgi:hypothetical protein